MGSIVRLLGRLGAPYDVRPWKWTRKDAEVPVGLVGIPVADPDGDLGNIVGA